MDAGVRNHYNPPRGRHVQSRASQTVHLRDGVTLL